MTTNPPVTRVHSVDALRGLDMLMILGVGDVVRHLSEVTGWGSLRAIEAHTHHPEWHGFLGWDLIFPLFLFLAGVSLPLSFAARLKRGASSGNLARHALKRVALLVILGAIYNGLFIFDGRPPRIASVLGRIGLAWGGAALLVIYTKPRVQHAVAALLLLGYWGLLTLVPAPGEAAASLEPGHTIIDWIDRQLVPGHLYKGVRDPEGLGALPPAIVTALFGVFAGRWLARADRTGTRKSLVLAALGAASLGLGWAWDGLLPVNKNLWTSSFVLVTAGWSLLLLALFHQVIDVWGWRRWTTPLVVVGANSILAYMARRFVDFDSLGTALLSERGAQLVHPTLSGLLLLWALLWLLWRKRLFLRV